MRKKDPARVWRKWKIKTDKKPPELYYKDTTEEIERALILNGPGRRMESDDERA